MMAKDSKDSPSLLQRSHRQGEQGDQREGVEGIVRDLGHVVKDPESFRHAGSKRPEPARQFVRDKVFHEVLAAIDNRTTLVLGHTRWRTRGDEQVNENNHPIRAGDILGSHNGTIDNANSLFQRFKLPRFAEVDSELLFRLAGRAARGGPIDIERFKARLKLCRGLVARST